MACEHKYVFMRTVKWADDSSAGYNTKYVRIDEFYCEKCLEFKEVRRETWSRDWPDWFKY